VDRKAIVTIPKKVALCCLENIHACIPPNKRDWNFLRVKEGFEEMYKTELEFPEGWEGGGGGLKKSLPWRRYGYFLELHI